MNWCRSGVLYTRPFILIYYVYYSKQKIFCIIKIITICELNIYLSTPGPPICPSFVQQDDPAKGRQNFLFVANFPMTKLLVSTT